MKNWNPSLLVMALFATILFSCQKSVPLTPTEDEPSYISNHNAQEPKKGCWDLNYTLVNKGGEWSCPSPKSNCSKIIECPNAKGIGNSAIQDFEEFSIAVENKKVKEYFSTEKWRNVILDLNTRPLDLQKLRDGHLTVVKSENSLGNSYYFIIPTEKESNFNIEDVSFAIEYTN